MKVTAILLATCALFLLLALPSGALASGGEGSGQELASERILVKFKQNVGPSEMAQTHRNLGGEHKKTIAGLDIQVVTVPAGQAVQKVKGYQVHPNVAYAEPDYVCEAVEIPDDVYFDQQWGMTKIEAPAAWDMTTGDSSVVIAILDSGIDQDHPDLSNKVVASINFSDSATEDDLHGHGTHVAGISAAITNNTLGVAGLGRISTLMNVKVLDDYGIGYYSSIANGIIWATDNGADVINMSLGATVSSVTLENAINYAWSNGVVVVAAAGNNGNSDPFYPAYYGNCIAVAATDSADSLTSWSNRGNWVDVAAPGMSIYSTTNDGSFGFKAGTSMASPHVAGLAALVYAIAADGNGNGLVNDEVRQMIQSGCDDIGIAGVGSGRINARKSIGTGPAPLPAPPPPTTDSMWVESITFGKKGPKLQIQVKVIDDGGPLPGAWIDLDLVNGRNQWAFSGITDSEGLARFVLSKPSSGTYVATTTNLTLSGFEWDTGNGITSASYVLGDSPTVKKTPPGKAKK